MGPFGLRRALFVCGGSFSFAVGPLRKLQGTLHALAEKTFLSSSVTVTHTWMIGVLCTPLSRIIKIGKKAPHHKTSELREWVLWWGFFFPILIILLRGVTELLSSMCVFQMCPSYNNHCRTHPHKGRVCNTYRFRRILNFALGELATRRWFLTFSHVFLKILFMTRV